MSPKKPAALPALPAIEPGRRYPVELALQYLGISRATFYVEVNTGRIATISSGHRKRRFVGGHELLRCMGAPSSSRTAAT